jgi:hypothetical protein
MYKLAQGSIECAAGKWRDDNELGDSGKTDMLEGVSFARQAVSMLLFSALLKHSTEHRFEKKHQEILTRLEAENASIRAHYDEHLDLMRAMNIMEPLLQEQLKNMNIAPRHSIQG